MMQLPPATCVLVAAGLDWLEALLPFLFVLFWILSQVFAVLRRLQGGRPAGAPRPAPPLPRFDPVVEHEKRRVPAGDAADRRGDLEQQIAEFLREANGEKRQQPAATPTVVRGPAGKPRPRPTPPAPPLAAAKPTVPQMAKAAVAATARGDHEAVDVSVARHVHDVFSRELAHLRGTLATDEPQRAAGPSRQPTPAEELVHLLRNPVTIRQVMLLREVIDRPVDRW